jgi:hypothetical protein
MPDTVRTEFMKKQRSLLNCLPYERVGLQSTREINVFLTADRYRYCMLS